MAFKKKTWIDRMVEFAGRRKITNVSTSAAQIIDVERAEGAVSQEGDAFSAENMNDLEKRISDAFADVPSGYKIADNDTTNNSEFLATARVAYEHGLEIDALSRDLSAMNDNGAITGMDAREDGVYITYVPADGADPVSKKLCDPDIKKHKITGKTFSVKASEISASKILGVGIEKFSYSVGVDNANWSYGCNISSSYSDDSASGSVSATWGGPAGAGNYNISATWIVYYLG